MPYLVSLCTCSCRKRRPQVTEIVAFIVFAFILGPAILVFVDEWRELRDDRDFYREFYEDFHEIAEQASKDRHPASVSVSSMPRLRRIK